MTSLAESDGTKSCSRRPQSWSRDISSSRPRTSEPEPMRAAARGMPGTASSRIGRTTFDQYPAANAIPLSGPGSVTRASVVSDRSFVVMTVRESACESRSENPLRAPGCTAATGRPQRCPLHAFRSRARRRRDSGFARAGRRHHSDRHHASTGVARPGQSVVLPAPLRPGHALTRATPGCGAIAEAPQPGARCRPSVYFPASRRSAGLTTTGSLPSPDDRQCSS